MQAYSTQNNGFKYILTCKDAFSKHGWARPLKLKEMGAVTEAFESILTSSGRKPQNLQTDDGSEFFNKQFTELMKRKNINLYSSFSPVKCALVERFNRTIKTWMWKEFTYRMNQKWVDILPTLIERYNKRVHRTIGMRPIDVNKSNEAMIAKKVYTLPKVHSGRKTKFHTGEQVRISKYKHVFEKGYIASWTNELFIVRRVVRTEPTTYYLRDINGQDIEGGFYSEELAKVKYPDLYLIEKVLYKRGQRARVKWYGFSSDHNSWVNVNNCNLIKYLIHFKNKFICLK